MNQTLEAFSNKYAIRMIAVGIILSFVTTAFIYIVHTDSIPTLAPLSVGTIATFLVLVPSLFSVSYGYRQNYIIQNGRENAKGLIFYFNLVAITLIISLSSAILTIVLFVVLSVAFTDAMYNFITAVLGISLIVSFAHYSIAKSVAKIDGKGVVDIMLAILAIGLLLAMLASDNPHWWENSLSYLGHDFGSNTLFNATLISVGVLLLVLSNILMQGFKKLVDQGTITAGRYKGLYIYLGVCAVFISGVGIFPTTVTPFTDFMHNLCIHVLAVIVVAGMFSVSKFFDFMSNEYKILSAVLGIASVTLFIFSFIIGSLGFVAFEVFLFLVFGTWAKITVENAYSEINKS